jgi:hypothetical protein
MPSFQSDWAKLRSSSLRALTTAGSRIPLARGSGRFFGNKAMPCLSVLDSAKQAAAAITHRDAGAGDRRAQIESSHPGQRGGRPPFEMHRQIGDQRAAADVHRLVVAQQRLAQALAFRFQT